ncbi:MAG: hypothetical protein IT363_13410 [Methanoregulaceae archaeon]|nr:hypothetical protein [Methanoregulaceae archaeon]
MAIALGRESFFWHKVHSLTGIVPVGFYMVQHLTLNSFSLGGAEAYDRVGDAFYSLPFHVLLALEVLMVWIPLAFHLVYGMFITSRAQPNNMGTPYKWAHNKMYFMQRATGVFLMVFLIFHFVTTTLQVKLKGTHEVVNYEGMQAQFMSFGYLILIFYVFGVLASSYHLAFGVWNFCIRWGITVSNEAQARIQRFAVVLFVLLTMLGWAALAGFMKEQPSKVMTAQSGQVVAAVTR